jgi:hypothetical protein
MQKGNLFQVNGRIGVHGTRYVCKNPKQNWGYWCSGPPYAVLPGEASSADLARALRDALSASGDAAPLRRAPKDDGSFLAFVRALGLDATERFLAEAFGGSVLQHGGTLHFLAQRRTGQGWVAQPEQAFEIPDAADDALVGNSIKKMLSLCT